MEVGRVSPRDKVWINGGNNLAESYTISEKWIQLYEHSYEYFNRLSSVRLKDVELYENYMFTLVCDRKFFLYT